MHWEGGKIYRPALKIPLKNEKKIAASNFLLFFCLNNNNKQKILLFLKYIIDKIIWISFHHIHITIFKCEIDNFFLKKRRKIGR